MGVSAKLRSVSSGQRLTFDLIKNIRDRVEYSYELLKRHRIIAGDSVSVNQTIDGRVVSALVDAEGDGGGQEILGTVPWNTRFDAKGGNTMNGTPQLYAVTNPAWNVVNSQYAVWVNPAQDPLKDQLQTIIRDVDFPASGNYDFIISADNEVYVYIDNVLVGQNINNQIGFFSKTETFRYVTQGIHKIKFEAKNTIGGTTWQTNPAGYSVQIKPSGVVGVTKFWGTFPFIVGPAIVNGVIYSASYSNISYRGLEPYPDSFQMTRGLSTQNSYLSISYQTPQPISVLIFGWVNPGDKGTNQHIINVNGSVTTKNDNYTQSFSLPAGSGFVRVDDIILKANGDQGTALRLTFSP